jgi:hydroxymethylbilane synthase
MEKGCNRSERQKGKVVQENMEIVIGTRGSKLALAQAKEVQDRLAETYPADVFRLKIIRTTGDRILDKPIDKIGDKGVFVREIERELLTGEIQLAVHSMKDMPAELPQDLCFAKAWKREDPRDVLVLRKAHSLQELPQGAVIGTGSKRRSCQLLALRPDLQIVNIRGNVDTRLQKMQSLGLDGLVLAAAGLIRLGREEQITQYLEPDQLIPAPAQGTLAIELRRDNPALLAMLDALSDEVTQRTTTAERAFLEGIGGDCRQPIGAHASLLPDGNLRLLAIYGDAEIRHVQRCETHGSDPCAVAAEAVRIMKCGPATPCTLPQNGIAP